MTTITAERITEQLDFALKAFGLYVYEDKGADEVMDLPPIVADLCKLTTREHMGILKEVARHKHSHNLVNDLIQLTENHDDSFGTTRLDELFQLDGEFMGEYY